MRRVLVLVTLVFTFAAFSHVEPLTALPAHAQQSSAPVTMESCEAQCRKCQKICENTLGYCKKKGGKHTELKHLNVLQDCILVCKTSAEFLSRKSENHTRSCAFCAGICKICAKSCESMSEDKQMKACAEECRRCAASCEEMAKMK